MSVYLVKSIREAIAIFKFKKDALMFCEEHNKSLRRETTKVIPIKKNWNSFNITSKKKFKISKKISKYEMIVNK